MYGNPYLRDPDEDEDEVWPKRNRECANPYRKEEDEETERQEQEEENSARQFWNEMYEKTAFIRLMLEDEDLQVKGDVGE